MVSRHRDWNTTDIDQRSNALLYAAVNALVAKRPAALKTVLRNQNRAAAGLEP